MEELLVYAILICEGFDLEDEFHLGGKAEFVIDDAQGDENGEGDEKFEGGPAGLASRHVTSQQGIGDDDDEKSRHDGDAAAARARLGMDMAFLRFVEHAEGFEDRYDGMRQQHRQQQCRRRQKQADRQGSDAFLAHVVF